MKEYSFEVKLRAVVRVRASSKNAASEVVESVLRAPSSEEIGLANEANLALGRAAIVTGTDFQPTCDPRLVRDKEPETARQNVSSRA
jgi:hypothetical protein